MRALHALLPFVLHEGWEKVDRCQILTTSARMVRIFRVIIAHSATVYISEFRNKTLNSAVYFSQDSKKLTPVNFSTHAAFPPARSFA